MEDRRFMHMDRYRADVDGLRAVAIVPVLLYHADFAGFRAGFVGVDTFFVISGFLITGLILPEVVQGRFSVRSFYERRVSCRTRCLNVAMGWSATRRSISPPLATHRL